VVLDAAEDEAGEKGDEHEEGADDGHVGHVLERARDRQDDRYGLRPSASAARRGRSERTVMIKLKSVVQREWSLSVFRIFEPVLRGKVS
jgi:hypothetical protein